jgi:hypothetical protein
MKTLARKSYDRMWYKVRLDLINISSDNFALDMPEINLMVAVLVQAGEDRDYDYILSQGFEDLCYNVKLHKQFVKNTFKRAWRIENSGEVWEPTPELIEEDM